MKKISKWILTAAALLVVLVPTLAADKSIDGKWDGVAYAPDADIVFVVLFKSTDGKLTATMDIPGEGLYGVALENVTREGDTISWVVPVPDATVECRADLQADGTMKGTFDQAGQTGDFKMERSKE